MPIFPMMQMSISISADKAHFMTVTMKNAKSARATVNFAFRSPHAPNVRETSTKLLHSIKGYFHVRVVITDAMAALVQQIKTAICAGTKNLIINANA